MRPQLPPNISVQSEPLTIGDRNSHTAFVNKMKETFGKIDCLVNNAGFAFKGRDPTPFHLQTKPTLDINFRGTVDFTQAMIPLLLQGSDPRIVNVASMAGRLSQVAPNLQTKFSATDLTLPELNHLVDDFEAKVQDGTHKDFGYSNSNYGMSKLALIAATKVLAREYRGKVAINCCCPGYCKTDMTSQQGMRDPSDGARNAVIPATMENPPTGEYFADYNLSKWE
jgi:carbonyl reductase 1